MGVAGANAALKGRSSTTLLRDTAAQKRPATQLVHNPSRGRKMKTAQTHDWGPTSQPVRFMAIA